MKDSEKRRFLGVPAKNNTKCLFFCVLVSLFFSLCALANILFHPNASECVCYQPNECKLNEPSCAALRVAVDHKPSSLPSQSTGLLFPVSFPSFLPKVSTHFESFFFV